MPELVHPPARLRDAAAWAGVQLLRLVPGAPALRIRRDLRDSSWLRHADVVIISFPKSGRTFVRAMLSRLFQRRHGIDERKLLEFPFQKAAPDVPRLLLHPCGRCHATPGPGASGFQRLCARPRGASRAIRATLPCRGITICGIGAADGRAVGRNSAAGPVHLGRARRHPVHRPLHESGPSCLGGSVGIVRYEDFPIDPHATLKNLARQVGLKVTKADLDDAVDFAHFGNLKEREREGYFTSARLQPSKAGDKRSSKVRVGGAAATENAFKRARHARSTNISPTISTPASAISRRRDAESRLRRATGSFALAECLSELPHIAGRAAQLSFLSRRHSDRRST